MKERVRISKDYLKYASFLIPKEECHYNVNKSDFVSAFIDSEKVPLLNIKPSTQKVFKSSKGIFWFLQSKVLNWLLISTSCLIGFKLFCKSLKKSIWFDFMPNLNITIFLGFVTFIFNFHGIFSQTIIFSETIGTCCSNTNTTTASTTFDNSGLTFSGTADTRTSIASSGYTGASGGRNVFFTNIVDRDLVISGINTTGYSSLTLSFGHYKSTNASNNELVVEVSTDGTNYTSLSYSRPTGSGTVNWLLITPSGSIPATANLRIRFRQTSTTPQFRVDDIKLVGILATTCSTPTQLTFTTQPSNVNQNTSMSPAVQVAATCSDGTIATGYSGSVTLTVNSPGCGYTPQTVTFVNGVATFSNIVFLRSPQTNLIFTASSTGLTSATSTKFSVNASLGAPTVTTIRQNNFDADQDWIYSVGADVNYGGTGSSSTPAIQGVGVIGVYNYSGNNVLRKSYSVDNASREFGCSNTITFNNQTFLSNYSIVDFTFNVLSFGSGTGAGNDLNEDFILEVSTNGGTSWNTILTKKGYDNCLFDITSSPVTSLSIGSSRVYTTGSCDTKSAFTLSMSGISQFQFRFTANNNRSVENWAIDNIKLTGTTYGVGAPFNLLTVNLGSDLNFCSGNSQELSATVSSFQPDLSYSWSPSTGLSASNISNPVVSGLSVAQTYTLTVTDGHGCIASDQVVVTPQFVKLSPIAFD